MRNSPLLLAALLGLGTPALASEVWRVTILSTQAAPKNNLTTAVPRALPTGVKVVVQCNVPARVTVGASSAVVAGETGTFLRKWERYEVTLRGDEAVVATFPAIALDTAVCNVYQVL